jgi:hypothetical protein
VPTEEEAEGNVCQLEEWIAGPGWIVHEGLDHFEKLKGVVFNFGFKIRVGLNLSDHVRVQKSCMITENALGWFWRRLSFLVRYFSTSPLVIISNIFCSASRWLLCFGCRGGPVL